MKLSRLLASLVLVAILGTFVLACTQPTATTPITATPAATTVADTPVTPPTTPSPIVTETVAAPVTPPPTPTPPTVATPLPSPTSYPNSGLLVNVKWLNDHSGDSNLVIIDTRSTADYAAGHIKNSINLPPSTFDGVSASVPTDKSDIINAKDIGVMLGQLWVSNKDTIIVYGNTVDANAGRLFWALEYSGGTDVRILDGGITKWKSANYTITTDTSRILRDPAVFVAKVNDKALATKSYVLSSSNNTNFVLVDARNAADYAAKRIPHAINILMADYLNSDGTVKLFSDLRAFLDLKAITQDKTVITYCPTGYRAAQAYYIYRLMGYNVADYDGSWAEWSADSSLPTEQ